ncbi:YisL family protein [Rossellomorea sp. LJF3]|uniref:YisL family protein n=1 Tax=Rossellomorea sp. LJF3 TaxID=3126099 RepID=UPI00300DA0B0
MFDNTHAHITTWVVAIILFFVAVGLHNAGKKKGMKVVHMILRLFYLLIILTGALLFWKHQGINPALYGIKGLVGIGVIGMFEMILVRMNKGKSTNVLWIVMVIALLIVLYLGLRLPLGLHPFA